METVVTQLDACQKELAEARACLDVREKELAALKAQVEQSAKLNVEGLAKVDAELKALQAALATEQAAHKASVEELGKAKAKLANPAFAAAAAVGQDKPTAEGGSVEGGEVKTQEQLRQEYQGIKDPVAKARWRQEHKAELGL